MDGSDNLRERGDDLHRRLLNGGGDLIADQISKLFLPLLTSALKRKFHFLRDPHLVESIASDSLLNISITLKSTTL